MSQPRDKAFWPAILLSIASASMTVGIIWDISWHTTIGRDSFWTPAHMAIYLGGTLGGFTGGWLAFKCTFLATSETRTQSVGILGARAPLGAWVAIWGAVAMLTSAPFDNWWHAAYGLDVKILSPPHVLLGLGLLGISVGALLLVLARQNRANDGAGAELFVFAGGVFLTLGSVFVSEFTFPNQQHTAFFYEVCSVVLPFRIVALGRAGRISWPATRAAAVYMGLTCSMIWILQLFPAQPKLAPIFNPVTHMVPPPFPLLLVFPALGIDVALRNAGDARGWLRQLLLAAGLGAIFVLLLLATQWYFSAFLLTPRADNWFFAGNRIWSYAAGPGKYRTMFWRGETVTASSLGISWGLAALGSLLGLSWGGWMRKVQR